MSGLPLEAIEALIAFGHKKETVEKWPPERIVVTLRACVHDMQIALNRAAVRAAGQDSPNPAVPRHAATRMERQDAINWLESATNPDDICQTIWSVCYVLTDNEARRVRNGLLILLRTAPEAPSGPEIDPDAAGATEPGADADSPIGSGQCPIGPASGLKTDSGEPAGRDCGNAHPTLPGM